MEMEAEAAPIHRQLGVQIPGAGLSMVVGIIQSLGLEVPISAKIGLLALGIGMMFWPVISFVARASLARFRKNRMLAPLFIIVLGLVVAIGGTVWLYLRLEEPPGGKEAEVAPAPAVASVSPVSPPAPQPAATPAPPPAPPPVIPKGYSDADRDRMFVVINEIDSALNAAQAASDIYEKMLRDRNTDPNDMLSRVKAMDDSFSQFNAQIETIITKPDYIRYESELKDLKIYDRQYFMSIKEGFAQTKEYLNQAILGYVNSPRDNNMIGQYIYLSLVKRFEGFSYWIENHRSLVRALIAKLSKSD